MKKTISKSMAWLLSVMMMFVTMIPITGITASAYTIPDEAGFAAKLNSLRNQFPDYYSGTYYENGVAKAWQCMGYAAECFEQVFGIQFYNDGFYNRKSYTMGELFAGDFVRTENDGHSIFITKVDGDRIYYTEANYWPEQYGPNKVRWDVSISYSELQAKFTYKVHVPENYLKGNPTPLDNVDIGTNFYAYIINSSAWKMAAVVNGNVQLQSETGFRNQLWYFERQDDLYYKLTNVGTNGCLDVHDFGNTNGTNVESCNSNDSSAQRWCFVEHNGKYVLHPKCSPSMALDLSGGATEDGTNLQLWETNGTAAQTFCVWKFDNKPNKPTVTSPSKNYTVGSNVKVSWGENAFATSYWVDVWHNGQHTESFGINDISYTVKNVTAGDYTVFVASCNPNGASETGSVTFNVPTYTISYNMNGGSGTIANQTKNYGQELTLSSTKPTRTGYDFVGWNTNASATTAQYQPGGKYTANSGATLYAIWKAKQITVTFYRNQNSSDSTTATQTFTYGVSGQSFSNKNWTKDGYTLLGWSNECNATTASYSVLSGVTDNWINNNSPSKNLYAVWEANTYTVSYNMNGGSGSIADQTKTYGQALTLSSTVPTKTDYKFVGWNTDANSTTALYQPGEKYTSDSDATLYAIWAINHNYTAKVIAPTCTEKGYTLHTCTNCEDSYKDTYTDKLEHEYGEWTITGDKAVRKCKHCGAEETKPLAASITLDRTSVSIEKGKTLTLKAVVAPDNAYSKDISWTSNYNSVAEVKNGVITAKSPGTTAIIASTSNGKIAVCMVTVTEAATNTVKNTSVINSDKVQIGDKVRVSASANGGTAPYTYAYYYKRSTNTAWKTLGTEWGTNSSVAFAPTAEASYDIKVVVKDSAGNKAEKLFTVNAVKELELTNVSVVGRENIKLGTAIPMIGKAVGGSAPYTYSFYFKRSTNTNWKLLGEKFQTTASARFKPTATGTYDIRIDVKDSNGTIVKKFFTATVK